MSDVRNVIIIGSGPAGYTAALYTARASLKPLVFEGAVTAGGALMNTTEVENFPGFQDGIMGPELMDNMRAQAERFGAELVPDDVISVDLTGEIKTVTDTAGTVYRAKTVIVTTGSQHRKLGLPNEDALSGRGVSWCATCDGFFFKDQDIAVIGGGDTAMEEATFLSRFAKSVTIVHRRDTLRASKAMQDRAFADPKIKFAWDSEIAEVHGDQKLSHLTLRNVKTGETSELPVTGLFIAIGHDPRTELFKGQLELDDEGYLKVEAPSTRTNLTGVFGAGDVVDHTYRQAITAAGTGCSAALDAERFLASLTDSESAAAATV
ncbi:thioredoxin-disulfide reductase [Streptomyces longhuiensis]|uniref:thioredoxin-disulfide reductase n=1 Tax=Streptomyces longhuiensis TaxID=2880933 RepID=UPI001D09DC0B|nr:thioredoxin-disulfide reductase [Streptomyces longhuiensis]UDM00969.1 thioredoxin-disulfide reductase [Streptomyces longhuiensis]